MHDKESDLTFMKEQNNWPLKVLLPLKRSVKGDLPELAVLLGRNVKKEKEGYFVVTENVFDLVKTNLFDVNEDLKSLNIKQYPSLEAIIEDGWEVD